MHTIVARAVAGALASAVLSTAAAGDAGPEPAETIRLAQASEATPAPANASNDTIEQIMVTGSRVRSDASGFEAPTPVTVLSAEALATRSATSIPDALNTLPQFQGSSNSSSSLNAVPATSSRGNLVNLRGLGFRRVLVLVNGQRLPPTQATGGVDLNVLPEALVERVDIVTGGASAAYGSDAVSGAVNYVLDRDYTGVKALVQTGTSWRGDNDAFKASVTGGQSFADGKLHLVGSFTHQESDGMERDRLVKRFGHDVTTLALGGGGTAASPFFTALDARYRLIAPGGLILDGPLAGNRFLSDGSITPFNAGTPVNATTSIGGDGGVYNDITPVTPTRIDTAYLSATYDFSPSVTLQTSVMAGASRINSTTQPPVNFQSGPGRITIFADNAFLDPALRAALGSTPSFGMSRISPDWWINKTHSNTDYLSANIGLQGRFANGWDWDVGYSYGVAKLRSREGESFTPNFFAAVDSVIDANGLPACRVNIVRPGSFPGCQPLNIFGDGAASREALDYIRSTAVFSIDNYMDIVSANARGDLGKTWAGPISVALGAEYRTQSLDQWSNSDPSQRPDFTGIRGVPNGALWFNRFNVGLASGEVTVREGYGEVLVPLARDLPWAQEIDLNAAVRYTDYSTSGNVVTWKTGLTYSPVDDLRFRGTVSRDIAAPSLFDLFAGQQVLISGLADPHTGVTSQTLAISGGNSQLRPEEADTLTLGVVFSPSWADGLTVALDYFKIEINDAITTPSSVQLIQDCAAAGGTGPACDRVIRPLPYSDRTAANYPLEVRLAPINQAQQNLEGIDLELRYAMPLSSIIASLDGTLSFTAYATKLLTSESRTSPTLPFRDDLGYLAYPKLKGSFSIGYRNGPFSLELLERYTGEVGRSNLQVYVPNERKWPGRWYTNLSSSYDVTSNVQAFMQVQNLFDQDPVIGASSTNPGFLITNQEMYDIIGRYGVFGLRMQF